MSRAYGIWAIEYAHGSRSVDEWLKAYDPEAFGGQGDAVFTADPARAMRFEGMADAMEFWRQASKTRPFRADGRPNRPLTAFTVEIRRLP